jgi:cytidine deaminase
MDRELYDAAVTFMDDRYGSEEAGVAAMITVTGKTLISVSPDTKNDALSLCMEVGACLEAHKLDEAITHSLCIWRGKGKKEINILTPCGICCERLSHWGGDVKVAISNPENNLIFRPLREFLPHHWTQVNGVVL